MNRNETVMEDSRSLPTVGNQKIVQDLSSAILSVKALIDPNEKDTADAFNSIVSVLEQAKLTLLETGGWSQERNTGRRIQDLFNPFETLLDILPVGIVIIHDLERRSMTINRAGLGMFGLPSGENIFRRPSNRTALPFKFLRAGKQISEEELPINLAITQNTALRDIELDVEHTDGKITNMIVYASPLHDESGSISGSLSVMVDITARKSIEKRLVMQYNIARVLAESNTINKAAPKVMQMICETAKWEYGTLWQVEPDMSILTNKGVWFSEGNALSEYADQSRYSMLVVDEKSLPGYALMSGKPLWLSRLGEFGSKYTDDAKKAGLHSAYAFPVKSGNRVIAILECLSNHSQTRDNFLTEMLNAAGNQVGVFLERKVLEETLRVRATQQHLLAEAGIALSSSLDLDHRLKNIAHLVVPEMADWCAIDLIDKSNRLQRVTAVHVDLRKEGLLYQIQPTREINFEESNRPQIQTLLTGQSLLYQDLEPSFVEASLSDPGQVETIRQLNPISSIIVPLVAHNQILGIFTFVYSDSGRRYSSADLVLAEDIVRRTALAVDNALLYNESQKVNSELEQRVDQRTSQLKIAVDELRKQIAVRQRAEEEIRILNTELEERIGQRTSQLEIANRDLHKELIDRKKTSEALRVSLKRTRELYRISQTIGVVRTPNDVLSLLLSSSHLKSVSRASIAILDTPWIENEAPPLGCFILTEWNRGATQPKFFGQHFTLEEYGVKLPIPYGQPLVIQDIQSLMELPQRVRKRFSDLKTHSLIILPLIAGGEWYGLLSLHFKTQRMTNMEDLRHVRGLVDESAIVIKNMRLLEAESQARQEAERANELKLKFLGMISHELRTPLTSIKGFTTTLLADDVEWPEDKRRDFLETINEESDKLHELIEQLLDLSRMEAGILRITPLRVSVGKILETAWPQLQALTKEHKLEVNMPMEMPLILADEQRIAQVITNLVNNAVKFSPAQTKITIAAQDLGQEIIVKVSDEGRGIAPEDRQRVFAAFRQLENGGENRAKGAGLGLAICKGLIEAHQGRIWVEDRDGPGTIIAFTLPTFDMMQNSPLD